MIKKLLLLFIFLGITTSGFAEDYYVYTRTYDKPELRIGEGGRSKKRDIVQILPCILDGKSIVPSEIEQKEWRIIKVSNLTQEQINFAMQSWQEQTGIAEDGLPVFTTKAYRKYKIDLGINNDLLNSTGFTTTVIKATKIQFMQKTELDLEKYEQDTRLYLAWKPIKEKIITIYDLIIPKTYAANTTHTVITDGGGDYLTLNAYEDAIDGTAYDPGETATVNCSGTTADTTAVTFTGWDADVAIYINGDLATTSGVHWSDNYYHLNTPNSSWGFSISLANTIVVTGIQVKTATGGSNGYGAFALSGGAITLNRVIVQGGGVSNQTGIVGWSSTTFIVKNTVIYRMRGGAGYGIRSSNSSTTVTIYNCTIYNCDYAVRKDAGTVTVKNCAVFGNTDDFYGIPNTIDYCASDDADGTNAVALNENAGNEWTDAFVSYATYDFHLQSGGLCTDAGTDLYGSGVTTDIDEDTLTVRNDIGADEYVSGAPPAAPRRRVIIISKLFTETYRRYV